jgi:hypothetical protein
MKELELLDIFCQFLDLHKFQYKREFRKRSYHNEGYVDVVIKHNEQFVAIEAKVSNFKEVLSQAGGNIIFFHKSYILYPRLPKASQLSLLSDFVGLIILENSEFRIIKKSISYPTLDLTITKRNWVENRVGRKMNIAEKPEGYDSTYLESTYDWVRSKPHKFRKGQGVLDDFIF